MKYISMYMYDELHLFYLFLHSFILFIYVIAQYI